MDPRARLDTYLEEHDLAAVWFAQPASFAWLTGGDNVVDSHADVGIAAAGYDGEDVTVVTNNIEAGRLEREELPDEVNVITYPWHDWSLPEMVAAETETPAAADFAVPNLASIESSALRQPLTAGDIERYRELGEDTAHAVESVCHEIVSKQSERTVAASLREALAANDIDAPVVLVGGSSRAPEYRHYTPTNSPLGSYALISVTTERDGLYASMTRTVAFSEPDWLRERHHDAAAVQTTALASTQTVGQRGGTASDVFADIQTAYSELGHPDEWKHHHQGGAAGYAGREWIATPTLDVSVELPMAYAWNPTIQGAKSEDTWLVTEDGFECLTRTGEWETISSEAIGFGCSLDHPTILDRN